MREQAGAQDTGTAKCVPSRVGTCQEPVSSPSSHLSMVLAAVTVHSPQRRFVSSMETAPTAAQIQLQTPWQCLATATRSNVVSAPDGHRRTLQGWLRLAARLLPWRLRLLPPQPRSLSCQGSASRAVWEDTAPAVSAGFSPPHVPSPLSSGTPTRRGLRPGTVFCPGTTPSLVCNWDFRATLFSLDGHSTCRSGALSPAVPWREWGGDRLRSEPDTMTRVTLRPRGSGPPSSSLTGSSD